MLVMRVVIALLRAVNVGGHGKIKMDVLRSICESLGHQSPCTYLQSGNVVFKTRETALPRIAARLADAIEAELGFRPDVILRTPADLRAVIAANPFAGRDGILPNRLLVTFLAADPGKEARDKVTAISGIPEEIHALGRELYIYYPDGAGKSKLSPALLDRILKTPGTARNWNTVTALLEMAGALIARASSSRE